MNLVAFAVLGRLLTWVLQTNGLTARLWKLHPILTELGECDFCLGCWLFTALAFPFGINLLAPVYVPVASEFVSGVATAFVVHLARIGWTARFGIVEFTEDK